MYISTYELYIQHMLGYPNAQLARQYHLSTAHLYRMLKNERAIRGKEQLYSAAMPTLRNTMILRYSKDMTKSGTHPVSTMYTNIMKHFQYPSAKWVIQHYYEPKLDLKEEAAAVGIGQRRLPLFLQFVQDIRNGIFDCYIREAA